MPELTADSEVLYLVEDTRRVFSTLGPYAVADVRDRLGEPVWYTRGPRGGSIAIRSKPGEAPRRDSGDLVASISYKVFVEGDVVSLEIYSDSAIAPYAAILQDKLDRPIITDGMIEDWSAQIDYMLSQP